MRKKTRNKLNQLVQHMDNISDVSNKNFVMLDEQVNTIVKMIVDVVDELDVVGERLTQLEEITNTTPKKTRLLIELDEEELRDLEIASDLHDMSVEDFIATVVDEAVASVIEADNVSEWSHNYEVSQTNHPSATSKEVLTHWLQDQAEANWKMRRNGEANSYEAVIKFLNGDK